jgi:DNA repair exonuclease SbcCD ATPase subunit
MAALRLSESEVHNACVEIAAQGERPTALTLLDKLGRGSLTTITKYLNSWNTSDEAKELGAESLPAVVELPADLAKESESLIKKIWGTAKSIADEELAIQREALRQAEAANQIKVDEAFKFSEAQAMKIDRLEDEIEKLRVEFIDVQKVHDLAVDRLNAAEKTNIGLSKDIEGLQREAVAMRNKIAEMEEANTTLLHEKQDIQQNHDDTVKQKEAEIRSLDMQVHKLQSSLDATAKANEQMKESIDAKSIEIRSLDAQIQKLQSFVESTTSDNNQLKSDVKAANKAALEAEKLVSNLQGKLEVYVSIDKAKPEKPSK